MAMLYGRVTSLRKGSKTGNLKRLLHTSGGNTYNILHTIIIHVDVDGHLIVVG